LEGYVTHVGIGVQNATVTVTRGGPFSYTGTTNANGHYLIDDIVPGIYEVSVEAPGFNPYYTTGVIISPELTTTLNIYLVAPAIIITPMELEVNLPPGQNTTRWLTISNTRDGPVEVRGSAHQNKKQVVSIPVSNGEFPHGTDVPSIGRASVSKPFGKGGFNDLRGSIGYAFDISPANTFFFFNIEDPGTQTVISSIDYAPSGGTFDATHSDFMYIIDYNTNMLMKVEVATGATIPVGTCTPYGDQSWTGITVDKTTNIMYGISTDMSESYLYIIDMETGTETLIGWLSIPGAIDITVDGNGRMYSFDIINDEAFEINKETCTVTLLGSLGYDANYAQGMGWDPISDNIYLAAYNNATGCSELRILDRVTGNSTLVGGMGDEIDGLAFPGRGWSWLSIGSNPIMIQPGSSVEVPVQIDATELTDGIYTGYLFFVSDPNIGTVFIPITLFVGPYYGPTVEIFPVWGSGPISIPVYAYEISNMGSFQFTIGYDTAHLTYTGTNNWYPGIADVTVGNPSSGKLTFVWAASTTVITIHYGTFFELYFNLSCSWDVSNIFWSDNPTPREFADWEGNIFVPYYIDGYALWHSDGVSETERHVINVYPNPSSDVVTVKSDFPIQNFEMMSYLGQTVYSEYNPGDKEVRLNVSSLPSGIYFLKINTGQGISTTKMAVEH
jgi:hypothetical protein